MSEAKGYKINFFYYEGYFIKHFHLVNATSAFIYDAYCCQHHIGTECNI